MEGKEETTKDQSFMTDPAVLDKHKAAAVIVDGK